MFYPYLFTYLAGKESVTGDLLSSIRKNSFGTGPDGLPGNDDCGAISAWYLFSALGFYPVCPASDEYRVGVPLFKKCEISLPAKYYSGKSIIIEKIIDKSKPGTLLMNGSVYEKMGISHTNLVKGSHLTFFTP